MFSVFGCEGMGRFRSYFVVGFMIVLCDLAEGNPYNYVVTAFERLSGEFWCNGGIISSNAVITACRCAGWFTPPDMFQFVLMDESELELKTYVGNEYTLTDVFVHRHCTPSIWNYSANDLGGWKIKGSFDFRFEKVLNPIFWEDKGDYKDALGESWRRCFVYGTSKQKSRINRIFTDTNQIACLDIVCKLFHLDNPACFSFQSELLNGKEICSRKKTGSFVFTGSPLFCKSNLSDRFIVYGMVGLASPDKEFLIWTRIDSTDNEAFYIGVMRGKADRLANTRIFLVLFLIKHTLPGFQ